MSSNPDPDSNQPVQPKSILSRAAAPGIPIDTSAFLILFTKVASGLLALGLVAILVFALQDINQFLSISTTAILIAAAALVLGMLVGFIFGIPAVRKEEALAATPGAAPDGSPEAAQPAEAGMAQPYRPNTNLERISDWLGTILVGIGLTQLLKVPGALESFGTRLRPALGGSESAEWMAIGVLILYTVVGFLIGFLWTRVKIPELYALSDLRQIWLATLKNVQENSEAKGERNAIQTLSQASPPADQTPKGVSYGLPEEPPASKRILWVDNHPENNKALRQLMAGKMPVEFVLSLSTAEALNKLDSNIDLVISDMERPGHINAGMTLLGEVKRKGFTKPYLVYASRLDQNQKDTIARMGGYAATSSPVQLMSLVDQALKS